MDAVTRVPAPKDEPAPATVVRPQQVSSAPSRGLVSRPSDPPSKRAAASEGD